MTGLPATYAGAQPWELRLGPGGPVIDCREVRQARGRKAIRKARSLAEAFAAWRGNALPTEALTIEMLDGTKYEINRGQADKINLDLLLSEILARGKAPGPANPEA